MIAKLSCDDLPLARFGSIPDYEHGDVDLPRPPPPLTDLPVLFGFILTTLRLLILFLVDSIGRMFLPDEIRDDISYPVSVMFSRFLAVLAANGDFSPVCCHTSVVLF